MRWAARGALFVISLHSAGLAACSRPGPPESGGAAVVLETPMAADCKVLSPTNECLALQSALEPIRINIDADGTLIWHGDVIPNASPPAIADMSVLERRLRNLAAKAAAKSVPCEVQVEPHQRAAYGKVVQVIAAAKQACKLVGIIGGFRSPT